MPSRFRWEKVNCRFVTTCTQSLVSFNYMEIELIFHVLMFRLRMWRKFCSNTFFASLLIEHFLSNLVPHSDAFSLKVHQNEHFRNSEKDCMNCARCRKMNMHGVHFNLSFIAGIVLDFFLVTARGEI